MAFNEKRSENSKMSKWQKTRAKGQASFILLRGILLRGGSIFAIMCLSLIIIRPSFPYLVVYILLFVLAADTIGYTGGKNNWRANEKAYLEYVKRENLSG